MLVTSTKKHTYINCKSTAYALAAIILPNLVFYIASIWLGASRPLFNIDYALAATLFSFNRLWFGLFIACLCSLFDALQIINQVYPFIRISDLLILIQLLPRASSWHMLIFSIVILSVLGSTLLVFFFTRHANKKTSLLILNMFLFSLVFVRIAYPQVINTAWRVERTGLIDSASIFFIEHRLTGNAAQFFVKGDLFDGSIKHAASALTPQEDRRHVLLIVAESWGVFRDEQLKNKIISPIKKLTDDRNIKINQGTLDFIGPTVAGEIRELCGVALKHLNMLELTSDVDSCLPKKFKANGYRSVALHAALGSIYWRRTWYPKIGFSETRFKENSRWISECKSFPGSCDEEIARTDVRDLLSETDPVFIYWLTLNSHQPYLKSDIRKSYFDCSEFDMAESSEVCRMAQLHMQFFSDLALSLSQESIRKVEVVIVGDHAPPLLSVRDATTVIEQGKVPWLNFVLE